MNSKTRFTYFFIAITIVLLGIISRKINGVPTYIGDILYAVLIYFGMRFLFLTSLQKTLLLSILFCFFIEFSQLIDWKWLTDIRNTTLGHYILGQGFLWSDLLCYTIGSFIAYFSNFIFKK